MVIVLNTTFQAYFHVRVALFKLNFLKDLCTKSWSWAQMKAENLRNSEMGLHASKLELLASKRNRAFFLRHPVLIFLLLTIFFFASVY